MKVWKISIVTIVTAIFIIVLPWIISPIYNNYLGWRLESGVRSLECLREYEMIEVESFIGKLNGNGNGMNFMTSVLLKTNLSIDEIENSLDLRDLKSIYSIEFELLEVEGISIDSIYLEREDLVFDALISIDKYEDYFVLSIYDGGYWGGFDIRGN